MVDRRDDWSGWVALLVTAALQALLPEPLSAGPSWGVVAVVGVLTAAGVWTHFAAMGKTHHALSIASSAVATGAVVYSIGALIRGLVERRGRPEELLLGAALLWSSNVLVFATWYWRLDAGGPQARHKRAFHGTGAFLFPQMTMTEGARHEHGATRWRPRFIDYLFIAFNTSTAFSPTDVPVLSRWAKVLMMTQAVLSVATLLVLVARAVSAL